MDFLKRVLAIREHVVARRIAGEELLIPVQGKLADLQRIFALDPVAAHIWGKLDGRTDMAAILESVVEAFDVTEDRARQDVERFIGQLEAAGLVSDVSGGARKTG